MLDAFFASAAIEAERYARLREQAAARVSSPSSRPGEAAPDPLQAVAEQRYAGTVPSIRAIMRDLRVGAPRARRIRARLTLVTRA